MRASQNPYIGEYAYLSRFQPFLEADDARLVSGCLTPLNKRKPPCQPEDSLRGKLTL